MAKGSMAYDLSMFEPPKTNPPKKTEQTKKQPAKKSRKRKTKQPYLERKGLTATVNRQAKEVTINKKAVFQLMAPLLVCLVCLPALLMAKADINELNQQIADIEAQIEIQEGESVRLNAELSGMLSSAKIEEYAENVLGMVKAESYQISYIDLSEGDKIIVSGNKIPGEAGNLSKKLEQLVAKIFG